MKTACGIMLGAALTFVGCGSTEKNADKAWVDALKKHTSHVSEILKRATPDGDNGYTLSVYDPQIYNNRAEECVADFNKTLAGKPTLKNKGNQESKQLFKKTMDAYQELKLMQQRNIIEDQKFFAEIYREYADSNALAGNTTTEANKKTYNDAARYIDTVLAAELGLAPKTEKR